MIVDFVYEHFNNDPDNAYFLASNNILFAKEHFLALGGFDPSLPRAGAEDRDFCDRWRFAGRPLLWRPASRVTHRHSQTLWGFIALHFRYGRGAHLYQASRRQRGSGTMREDLGFYRSLPRRLVRHLAARHNKQPPAGLLAALALWQLANAAGFAVEAISGPRTARSPAADKPVGGAATPD